MGCEYYRAPRRPNGFRPLQHRCVDMSSSVLGERLTHLEEARLLQRSDDGRYALTRLGHVLARAIVPLDAWSNAGPAR